MTHPTPPFLLLASGSSYRAALLARLHLPFVCHAPDIDETPQSGESAADLVLRLARAKAQALRARYPQHWIIGSDQAATLNGHIIGKPGTRARAIEQLERASAQRVMFETGLTLLTPHSEGHAADTTTVQFRALSTAEIVRYVDAEQPLDCAGSFKCEGYGISLFESIESQDPTALVGLPLIALCRLLRQAGLALP